jgi:uncharacterized protein (DUF433 family)
MARLDIRRDGIVLVRLSHRNVAALLAKADDPTSAKTVTNRCCFVDQVPVDHLLLVVQVETNDDHYSDPDRDEPPGAMHARTEAFIRRIEQSGASNLVKRDQSPSERVRDAEHPLIHFANGPNGRRARLDGTGLDVWEVFTAVRRSGGSIAKAADRLETEIDHVRAALTYCAAYPDRMSDDIQA